jgi:Zn finger protein HypA/HybF involved in hydrogenase expression
MEVFEGGVMVEEVYKRNRRKKKLSCLKCGRPMLTTVTRRICRRCTKRNYEVTPVTRHPLLQGTDYRTNEFEME